MIESRKVRKEGVYGTRGRVEKWVQDFSRNTLRERLFGVFGRSLILREYGVDWIYPVSRFYEHIMNLRFPYKT
jgi:hypothetical protein